MCFRCSCVELISIQYTNTDSIVIESHLLAVDGCGADRFCEHAAVAAAAAVAISLLLRAKRDLYATKRELSVNVSSVIFLAWPLIQIHSESQREGEILHLPNLTG